MVFYDEEYKEEEFKHLNNYVLVVQISERKNRKGFSVLISKDPNKFIVPTSYDSSKKESLLMELDSIKREINPNYSKIKSDPKERRLRLIK